MAAATMGTNATTSLTTFSAGFSRGTVIADIASLANIIKDDQNVAHPIDPGSFARNGLLFVPNRGVLQVLPGDYVGIDNQGWPILVSANSIANSTWTKSA
jgi:hypothetical protein